MLSLISTSVTYFLFKGNAVLVIRTANASEQYHSTSGNSTYVNDNIVRGEQLNISKLYPFNTVRMEQRSTVPQFV